MTTKLPAAHVAHGIPVNANSHLLRALQQRFLAGALAAPASLATAVEAKASPASKASPGVIDIQLLEPGEQVCTFDSPGRVQSKPCAALGQPNPDTADPVLQVRNGFLLIRVAADSNIKVSKVVFVWSSTNGEEETSIVPANCLPDNTPSTSDFRTTGRPIRQRYQVLPAKEADGNYCSYLVPLERLRESGIEHNQPVKVRIEKQTSDSNGLKTESPSQSLGTRVKRRVTLYRVGRVPVWVPVGLVMTNFVRLNSGTPLRGVPFGAAPAGLAFGFKTHFRGDFYLGYSVAVLYAIHPTARSAGEAAPYPGGPGGDPSNTSGMGEVPAESQKESGSFSLYSLAVPALVDVGGFVHVGAGPLLDFTLAKDRAKFAFVLGAGSRIIELLKGKK